MAENNSHLKFIAAALLFLIAMAGGLSPLYLQKINPRLSSAMNAAAAGVFFASAMVHMLPEASATLSEAWGESNGGKEGKGRRAQGNREVEEGSDDCNGGGGGGVDSEGTPWGGLLCSAGFLMILCLDYGVAYFRAVHNVDEVKVGVNKAHGALTPDQHGPEANEQEDNQLEVDGLLQSHMELLQPPQRAGEIIGGQLITRSVGRGDHSHVHGGHGHRKHAYTRAGHSHEFGSSSGEEEGWLATSALLLALSFHAVMEGLGVGAGNSSRLWGIVIAILVHKGLAAYALTSAMLSSHSDVTAGYSAPKRARMVLCLAGFSCMTPLGIWIGSIIGGDGEGPASAACVALAAGTFLYVSLMEVLPQELNSPQDGFLKLGALLGGFTVTTIVSFFVE